MWGWMLIIMAIGLILLCVAVWKNWEWAGLAGISIILFSWLPALILGFTFTPAYTEHEIETYHLVAMRNESSASGTFFLGCGSLGGQEYVYYEKIGDGYSLGTIAAEGIMVYEEARIDGVLLKKTDSIQGTALWFSKSRSSYEFHIPKGSIIGNFELQ